MKAQLNTNEAKDAGSAESKAEIFLAQARTLVKDLFAHSAWIYWTDFLLSLSVAYGAVALYLFSPTFSALYLIGFTIAAFALFRCGVFIHEIAHMPGKRMRPFRAAWNILFGIPTLMPSFAYKCHMDHHNPRHFGTARDENTWPSQPAQRRVSLFTSCKSPCCRPWRYFVFLVLTPLSFLHPQLRRLVLERASSFVINPQYRRTMPVDERHGSWIVLELAIFMELAVFLVLLIAGKVGWSVFAELYVLGMAASGLNWVRTHRGPWLP